MGLSYRTARDGIFEVSIPEDRLRQPITPGWSVQQPYFTRFIAAKDCSKIPAEAK